MSNFPRVFQNLVSPVPLSYLDDNFGALETGSTSTVSISGASLLGYIQTGSGAVARSVQSRLQDFISVKDFGAVGDGSADDTSALQAAITAASASAAKILYIPSGSYKTTSTIVVSKACQIVGSTPLGVFIIGTGLSSGQAVVHVDGTINPNLDGVTIENLTIMSSNSVPDLLKLNTVSSSSFRNIFLRDGSYGIVITGARTFSLVFDRCIYFTGSMTRTVSFESCTSGQYLFSACSFGGTVGVNVDTNSWINGIGFVNCNFESCTQQGFNAVGKMQSIAFSGGCRFEKNGAQDILIAPDASNFCYGIDIRGDYFETDAAVLAPIEFGGSGQVRGFSVQGNYAQDYSNSLVRLNGEGQSGIVCGNRLEGGIPNAVSAVRPGVLVFNNENNSAAIEPTWNPTTSTADYTVTNPTTLRSLDVSAGTLTDVKQVLGTLIADLIAIGFIK